MLDAPRRMHAADAVHAPSAARARVLVTDQLFPNAQAAWRKNQLAAFIERFDTDVLAIGRIWRIFGQTLPFDWDALRESHHLDRYDIVIFDSTWNWVQQYNDAEFNGTRFNDFDKCGRATYLLRLKKYRNEPVDLMAYDAYYHIFCNMAHIFNDWWDRHLHGCRTKRRHRAADLVPLHKQVVWMAPGGGLSSNCQHECVDDKLKEMTTTREANSVLRFATTQSHIHACVVRSFPRSEVVLTLGGPINAETWPPPVARGAASEPLNVCFTTLGIADEKGTLMYLEMVDRYREAFPGDSHVVFHGVGAVPDHPGVIHHDMMSQNALDRFYQDMHVYINLDQRPRQNGWPLGSESMAHGTFMFTTVCESDRERDVNGHALGTLTRDPTPRDPH